MIGRVKNTHPNYYGFITTEDGEDHFFHGDQYQGDFDELRKISPPHTTEGPLVKFTPVEHPKGKRAFNVKILEGLEEVMV